MTMDKLLCRLAAEYNRRSELVALNKEQLKRGECDDGTLQWNRGALNQIEEYLHLIAREENVKITYEYHEHDFGFGEWSRKLSYNEVYLDFGARHLTSTT